MPVRPGSPARRRECHPSLRLRTPAAASHVGRRREPWKWCAVVVFEESRMWRHTMRGLHHTNADPAMSRLPRGHRALGTRPQDGAIPKIGVDPRKEVPWQTVTENRLLWKASESVFVRPHVKAESSTTVGRRALVGGTRSWRSRELATSELVLHRS